MACVSADALSSHHIKVMCTFIRLRQPPDVYALSYTSPASLHVSQTDFCNYFLPRGDYSLTAHFLLCNLFFTSPANTLNYLFPRVASSASFLSSLCLAGAVCFIAAGCGTGEVVFGHIAGKST